MKRRVFVTGFAALLAAPVVAEAQPAAGTLAVGDIHAPRHTDGPSLRREHRDDHGQDTVGRDPSAVRGLLRRGSHARNAIPMTTAPEIHSAAAMRLARSQSIR